MRDRVPCLESCLPVFRDCPRLWMKPLNWRTFYVGLVGALVALAADSACAAEHGLRVGSAAALLEADDSMVTSGGIGPGKPKGQEGELRAVAVVLEKEPFGRFAVVAC